MKIKIKINTWDLTKYESFCIAKKIINKMKNNTKSGKKACI